MWFCAVEKRHTHIHFVYNHSHTTPVQPDLTSMMSILQFVNTQQESLREKCALVSSRHAHQTFCQRSHERQFVENRTTMYAQPLSVRSPPQQRRRKTSPPPQTLFTRTTVYYRLAPEHIQERMSYLCRPDDARSLQGRQPLALGHGLHDLRALAAFLRSGFHEPARSSQRALHVVHEVSVDVAGNGHLAHKNSV